MNNELKNRIESNVITRTFKVSGMPESVWAEVDTFCKEMYGNARWVMIADLVKKEKDDYKYAAIYDTIITLKQEVAMLKDRGDSPRSRSDIPSFGKRKEEE